MDNEDKIGVALVKEACPLCGKLEDGPIVINTRLSVPEANRVKAMHGQTIGHMNKPCDSCKDLMTKGILLIGFVEAKTTDMNDPYRSGNQWVVTEDFIKRVVINNDDLINHILDKRYLLFPVEAAERVGLPDANVNV